MPTIEIVSLRARGIPVGQEKFGFAIWQEPEPVSHRSLFFDHLQQYTGVILHLGNPAFNPGTGGFHASALIDWPWTPPLSSAAPENERISRNFYFRFRPEFRPDLERLLQIALDASPEKRVFFLTDYQFGPEKARFAPVQGIGTFWHTHDTNGLLLNALYELNDTPGSSGP